MTTPRRIVILSVVAVACLVSYFGSLGTVGAQPAPDDVFTPAPLSPSPPPPEQTIVHTGSPMWTYVLVAALSVVLTLVVTFAAGYPAATFHRYPSGSLKYPK